MRWFAPKPAVATLIGAMILSLLWWIGPALRDARNVPEQNNFSIEYFHADYELSSSDSGALLKATETILVWVPDTGTRGIYRDLPLTFHGRDTPIDDVSAEFDGAPVPIEQLRTSMRVRVWMGNPDQALAGFYRLEITYTYRNVVSDSGSGQRFEWNINDLGWPQGSGSVSATIRVMPPLSDHLTGAARCFVDGSRSPDECTVSREDSPDGIVTFDTSPSHASGRQAQTVDIGLTAGAVAAPGFNTPTRVWVIATGALTGIPAVLTLVALISAATRRRRALGPGPHEAQFTPSQSLPPILAASLVSTPARGVMAELLRAASERVVELGGRTAAFLTATLVRWPRQWQPDSQAALDAVFPLRRPGAIINVSERIANLSDRQVTALQGLARERGLIKRPRLHSLIWLMPLLAVAGPAFIITRGLSLALPGSWVAWPVIVLISSLAVARGLAARWRELTPAGESAYRYLNGLRMFLQASESERIRMLQRAEPSQQVGPEQLVPILARLAPYAVVLGLQDS